ncbi:hypothetical protein [Tritonibacter scottomollicae]|uniref:hypothetical protein n=1 Tax=Tritonibacter scottomollicae TaxID=483013 RepID=UPI003BA995DB
MRSLTKAMEVLTDRCITGIRADADRCADLLGRSLVLATALVPVVGYEAATRIAKTAHAEGRSIAEVAADLGGLTPEDIEKALARSLP